MFPAPKKLGKANFGASTFFASAHPGESCGSNGLPLTPNSIRIFGRARELLEINHPHLCSYIDVHRGKHERIIVVQEHYPLDLKTAVKSYDYFRNEQFLLKFTRQIIEGLCYLNNFGTVCRSLGPETILVDPQAEAKLYGYGLYYMTEAGSAVSFPIGSVKYLPPEVILSYSGEAGQGTAFVGGNPTWDVWSLGFTLLEVFLGAQFFPSYETDVKSVVLQILDLSCRKEGFVSAVLNLHNCSDRFTALREDLQQFFHDCLCVDVDKRPTPLHLLSHSVFSGIIAPMNIHPISLQFPVVDPSLCLVDISVYKSKLGLNEESYADILTDYPYIEDGERKVNKPWRFHNIDHLAERSIGEIYHLWQLAGGNVEQELKKQKLIHNKPSVLTLPSIMIKEGEVFGGGVHQHQLLQSSTICLPLSNLRKRHIPVHSYYPLITQGETGTEDLDSSKLPLVIRERDVEYQFRRIVLFERLLQAYPFKGDAVIREARKDIPPFYRGLIWAALLRVDGAVTEEYKQIDKETPTSTDRQIEVDIPRCHQYDELLSSPLGHSKFTRILKAWVVSHPDLVYWQGLDSLCAPFLYLHFNNEALAYACLSAFIRKYLHQFFLKDNSAVIHEYLAKFSHLIAFHDPRLFNHLHEIDFAPELYAISWFLTMFTHVFPLHKIFILWDTLLLGGSSLPLCVGLAILKQIKDRLLQFGFNECILLFSDMPDINMEKVVKDALDIFCSTPASLTYRQHDINSKRAEFMASNPEHPDMGLLMEPVPLEVLQREICGQISGAELLELFVQRPSRGGRSKVFIIDVSPREEYLRGTLAGAINIPAESAFSPDGTFGHPSDLDLNAATRGKIVTVMGSKLARNHVTKVAEALLMKGYPRVCTLHGGIEVFHTSGHLVVPSA